MSTSASYGSIQEGGTPKNPLMGGGSPAHSHGSASDSHQHEGMDGSFKAAVFGFSDGLTTNINLVIGVYCALAGNGAQNVHQLVVMTGMAGLFAGASSMACGEWLSAKGEEDSQTRELEHERDHLTRMPETEGRHMKELLQGHGLSAETADAINRDVQAMPIERQVAFHGKFELGIDTDDGESAIKNALYMWICFAVGAFIPVLPWFITMDPRAAFIGSCVGSALGVIATSIYQVRGHYDALPKTLARQLVVTAVAVAATAGFTVAFTHAAA